MKLKNKTPKGFTLIELLVVISIIGVLSSVVMVSLNNAKEKARNVVRKSDVAQIKKAIELCTDDEYIDTTGGSGNYSRPSMKCLGFESSESCFNGRHSGLDSLQTCLSLHINDPSRSNAIFDTYLYSSACHISHFPPSGGPCIYWQPEGEISDSICFPGKRGGSGSDVCGYSCNFCTLKIGN